MYASKKPYLIAAFLCLFTLSLQAQPYRFKQLNEQNGLSSNHVTAMLQDQSGMLWIGTANGLNLYDGQRFRVFYHNEWDSLSIGNNYISALALDKKGRLWTGSYGTVSALNKNDVAFHTYQLPGSRMVYVLYLDAQNRIWCGTDAGLFVLDEQGGKFKKTISIPVYDIEAASENPFLVLSSRSAVLKFDPDHAEIIGSISDQFRALGGQLYQPTSVAVIRNGFVLGNPLSGLFITNTQTESYTRLMPGDKEALFSVQCLLADSQPQVWVGSTRGLYVYNLVDSSLSHVPEFLASAASKPLAQQNITSLFCDKSGLIWVGTRDNGIYQLGTAYSMFLPYQQPQAPQKRVTCFSKLSEYEVLIGTESEGLFIWDKSLNLFRQIHKTPFVQVNCLLPGTQAGEMWVGSETGLFLWNREKNTFTRHRLYSDTMNQEILSLCGAADNNLWIGTNNGLVFYYPKNKDVLIYAHSDNNKNSICHNVVQCLYSDAKQRLWVGTQNGLDLLNAGTRTFEHLSQAINSQLPDVMAIAGDPKGNLWITLNGSGLVKLQPETHKVQRYSGGRELKTGTLRGLVIQSEKYLWIGSINNLIRLNTATGDKQYFGVSDGLPSGEHSTASLMLDDGNMLLGTNAGFYMVAPANYQQVKERAELCISHVMVNDADMAITDNLLQLQKQPRKLIIRFGLNNFTSNSKNVFRYRMEGVDEDWNECSDGEVQYNNLPGGKYKLFVSVWTDGVETVAEKLLLEIDVTPPFWQTFAFKLLIGVLLAGLVWWLTARYMKKLQVQLEEKHKLEKQAAELELHAYKMQLDSRYISAILYNIQDAIANNDLIKANAYLTKFSSLLSILLEYGDKDFITVEQLMLTLEFYLSIEKLRFGGQLEYQVECSPKLDRQSTRVPNMIVQPYVQNAIVYGLKLKIKDRKVNVKFEPWSNQHILCTVEDNGIGRKAAAQKRDLHGSENIKLAEQRMNMLEQASNLETRLEVIDLYNDEGEALGTRVMLHLPLP